MTAVKDTFAFFPVMVYDRLKEWWCFVVNMSGFRETDDEKMVLESVTHDNTYVFVVGSHLSTTLLRLATMVMKQVWYIGMELCQDSWHDKSLLMTIVEIRRSDASGLSTQQVAPHSSASEEDLNVEVKKTTLVLEIRVVEFDKTFPARLDHRSP